MRRSLFLITGLLLITAVFSVAQRPLAPTPPMGWNSWDSYGKTATEDTLRRTANVMARDLKQYGWTYIVTDDGWFMNNPGENDARRFNFAMDANGRYIPAVATHPSAANNAGLKPLIDYVHSRGLKFGIWIIRGIPREAVAKNLPIAESKFHAADAADQSDACPWNVYNWGVKDNAAGQAYYDSIAKLYAGWGVDFIKADCIAHDPYKVDEIRMLSDAIRKSGRAMVLSLSPGPAALANADEMAKHAEMWRISGDVWDHWGPDPQIEWSQSVRDQFATAAAWNRQWGPKKASTGHWPDADMLVIGNLPHAGTGSPRKTKLTADEQVSMMTLWSIFRSPLIIGGDLLSLDALTRSLLTNKAVLDVDQHSKDNRAVITDDKVAIWTARPDSAAGRYVSVTNLADSQQSFDYDWTKLGLASGSHAVRDLWKSEDLGAQPSLKVTLQPHASVLYRVQ